MKRGGKVLAKSNNDTPAYLQILFIVAAAVLGFVVMVVYPPWEGTSSAIIHTSGFVYWAFFNVVAFALYPILGTKVWQSVLCYKEYAKPHILVALVPVVALLCVPTYFASTLVPITNNIALTGVTNRFLILLLTGGIAVGLPGITALLLLRDVIARKSEEKDLGNVDTAELHKWRGDLKSVVSILGGIVGLLTLATASFRAAGIQVCAFTAKQYPVMYVLIYGLYFTILIAIVYNLPRAKFRLLVSKVVNSAIPLPELTSKGLSEEIQKRKALHNYLDLSVEGIGDWHSGVAIAAPLLSGVVSILLSGKVVGI